MKRALAIAALCFACAHGTELVENDAGAIQLDTKPPTQGNGCGVVELRVESVTPTIMLLIDQSASMREPMEPTIPKTKWELVRDALTGASGLIPAFDDKIRFGATLYHSNVGLGTAGSCPMLTSVPIALGASASIDELLAKAGPGGDTPTGASIDNVAARLAVFDEPGPKFILLATDGEPDTCEQPNPEQGQNEAIASARLAFRRGIGIIVLAVGTEVTESHLQQMANAGAGMPSGSGVKPYRAIAPDELRQRFEAMIRGVRSCSFLLHGKVARPDDGEITIDGARVPFGTSDGYQVIGDDTLAFYGASCKKIQDAMDVTTIVAKFPCEDLR